MSWRRRLAGIFARGGKFKNCRRDAGATKTSALEKISSMTDGGKSNSDGYGVSLR
jgi:hypothetical protein